MHLKGLMHVNPWNVLSLSRVCLNSSPLPGVFNICVFRWELCGRSKCYTFSRLWLFFLQKCYPYPVVMRQCTSTEASHVTGLSMTLLAFVVTSTLHVLWSVLYLDKTLQYWFIYTFPGLACHRSFYFCFGWSLTVPDMKDSSDLWSVLAVVLDLPPRSHGTSISYCSSEQQTCFQKGNG